MKRFSVKQLTLTAVCIALCCVLPTAFHSFGLGTTLSPIHIPVLLCGMLCGGWYGLFCGIAGPVLSSLITSMPPAAGLVSMVPELAVYGLVTGLCMHFIRTKHSIADIYLSLVIAMVAGRIVGGIAKALFYMGNGQALTLAAWATSYFVATLPGIIAHLIIIPILVFTLERAKVIPARYA